MLLMGIVSLVLWKNSVFTRVKSYELIGEFEAINGLLENAIVKYRGYPIGRVTKIAPYQKNIQVHFFVQEDYKIPKGSTVKIIFDGLVGEKYMEIIPNPLTTFLITHNIMPHYFDFKFIIITISDLNSSFF